MSMDRLVELFLESARPDSDNPQGLPFGGGAPDEKAIEKGLDTVEKLMTSDDAIQMGGSPSATFVCLGMALEEKPKLGGAAIRFYEKALQYLGRRTRGNRGGWEACVVLQQLSAVGLRLGRLQDASKWLEECAEECKETPGHPREATLFSGAFNTQQTRSEFAATIEKMRAQVCVKLGNNQKAHEHVAEAQRLEAIASQDAVERQQQEEEERAAAKASGAAKANGSVKAVPAAKSAPNPSKELWAATPKETRELKEYRYMDEGATVSVLLELNEHLGIGAEASEVVQALSQFRVRCEKDSVDVQLRLRRKSGEVCHFRLLLAPLSKSIVPEDTVPKLRGKEGKRRLEVKLFKQDKSIKWYGDIVSEIAPKKSTKEKDKAQAKGSLLNPLTPEELAALPTPGGAAGGDNRPSSWQQAPRPSAPPEIPSTTPSAAASPSAAVRKEVSSKGSDHLPSWVATVTERREGDATEIVVSIGDAAGETVGMQDLELDADAEAGFLRLRLLSGAATSDDVLELTPPAGADLAGLVPKWRRKLRSLVLRFPAL